jgi:hypothetical protein
MTDRKRAAPPDGPTRDDSDPDFDAALAALQADAAQDSAHGTPDQGADAGGLIGDLVDTIRKHPVGTAMIVAGGVALLMAPRAARSPDVKRAARQAGTEAQQAADTVRTKAGDLRARVEDGTAEMTEEARDRVIAARRKALAAADRAAEEAGKGARRGSAQTREAIRAHPLLAGTLALAAGAVLGASLPRSRTEDEHLGAMADRLGREAQQVYRQERDRLMAAAAAAVAPDPDAPQAAPNGRG